MARVRRSGGAGLVVATVMFGFAFVVSLVLAIVFATQSAGDRQRVEDLEAKQKDVVRAREIARPDIDLALKAAKAQGKSLVLHLVENITQLADVIDRPDATLTAIENARTRAYERIKQKAQLGIEIPEKLSLLAAIERLEIALGEAVTRAERAEQQAEGFGRQVDTFAKEHEASVERYDKAERQLVEHSRELDDKFRQEVEANAQQVSDLDDRLRQIRTETSDEIEGIRTVLAAKLLEIKGLQEHIDELTRGQDRKASGPTIIAADGRIVSVTPDRDLVYIDLSRNDRILPGMTFEVFEKDTVVKLTEGEPVRGKATIEIVNALDSTSKARVVRRETRAVVIESDQIVNVAYDRNTEPVFVVHGDFDIDHRGVTTQRDKSRVRALIERWGGGIVDKLTYQVDYLVLGLEPAVPVEPPEDAPFSQHRAYVEARNVYNEFQDLITVAKELRIPVLNQNRALALLGYYRR